MKRGVKRAVAFCLCAALCALAAGCVQPQNEEPTRRSIRVGVTVYDQYDTFIGEMMYYFGEFVERAEQEQGVVITVMQESADGNQEVQNNQVERFIEAGCDVICVNLVDRTDVAVIIDKAEAAGLPILFFNRELVEEDLYRSEWLYYVGAEALQSGTMQGEIVAALCDADFEAVDRNGDGVLQYVMLEGQPGHQDAIVRTEYSVAAVAQRGYQLERLEDEIANWVRAQAETWMTRWLDTHGAEIEVVFANNDDMALGAIDALKRSEIPMERWPVVVGIDGTAVGLDAVVRGEMAGTVYNDAQGQAQGLLDLALWLAADGPDPEKRDGKYIRLPYQSITADNVYDFLH